MNVSSIPSSVQCQKGGSSILNKAGQSVLNLSSYNFEIAWFKFETVVSNLKQAVSIIVERFPGLFLAQNLPK